MKSSSEPKVVVPDDLRADLRTAAKPPLPEPVLLPPNPRRKNTLFTMPPREDDYERHLGPVVEALCAVEVDKSLRPADLPYASAWWFLDHARHFQSVAFASLRLMEHLAAIGDERLRARVASALVHFAQLKPVTVEQQLFSLATSPSREVRAAITDTLVALLRESDDRIQLMERWHDRSDVTRELVQVAIKLLALRDEGLSGPITH